VDRPSRFVVAWASGPRTPTLAEAVVQTTRQRTLAQAGVPWISDGWDAYAESIADIYCDPIPAGIPGHAWFILHQTPGVRLTQAVKHRRRRRLVRVDVRATIGAMADQPYTVHIERLNGVLRDRLACLTRKTHAFAKQPAMWDAAVGLALFAHNWLRPHPALRVPLAEPAARCRYQRRTPAMVLGLTDHCWSLVDCLTRPVPHYGWG
jgi:IS1 family transposase